MSKNFIIDLHTHSNYSDGSLTPTELVLRAAGAGIAVLALTDHDTVAGFDEARRQADRCGIGIVPGVEISAGWRAQAIHVLGLWIDPASPQLLEQLASQAERRRLRMQKICARLGTLGLPGDELLTAVRAQPGVPTRAHLADALVAGGHVGRAEEAFRKYLGKGKAAHFAAEWPPLAEVVAWIRAAGGIASLAHPARYALSGRRQAAAARRFHCGRRRRHRSRHRRQRCAARGSLRHAGRQIRPLGLGRFGLPQPDADLESLGPLP